MTRRSSLGRDEWLQRELWALALLALAVLFTLSFVPPAWMGGFGVRVFPTGNIVGVVGRLTRDAAWSVFGIAGYLLPVFPALWAAAALERMDQSVALRYTALLLAATILVPTAIYAFSAPLQMVPASTGWLGRAIGAPLAGIFGWLGAGLLLSFLGAAVCVVTLGWNPLRSMVGGSLAAWTGTRRTARTVLERLPHRTPEDVDEPARLPDDPGWTLPDIDLSGPDDDDEGPLAAPASGEMTLPAPAPAVRAPKPVRRQEAPADPIGADTGDPAAADLPPTGFLTLPPPRDDALNRRALDGLGQVVIDKLATFKIQGEIVGMTTGPVVTQFEISPAPGIKVARIASLDADLALALRAPSVRIVAPIPGKGAVGVEVPNPTPEMVYFREVLESPAFRNSKAQLPLALGKDIAGKPYVADLARMPHLLIAGATGSGKSVCVNTIITSLIYRHSPRTLRLLMVDPKMVELSMYNDLPHLRHPVVTDNNDAAGVLKWAVLEMEHRYSLLSVNGVRNLQDFNKRVEAGHLMRTPEADGEEGDPDRWIYKRGPLPFIVLIIDELADLMMTVQGDVEKPLALLAQKARAIGIHLIVATQRPSVNVLTGLIKANFPSRIAFRVASKVDSRTILDQNGADNLLGNGDMLYLSPSQNDPLRCQGAYLSTEETEAMMDWFRARARDRDESAREDDILEVVRATEGEASSASGGDEAMAERDRLFRDAAELCIQHQGGSTSLLQRRLRIGYGRAARIIDQLHNAGVLGPPDGSKPREVLVDLIQLDQVLPHE